MAYRDLHEGWTVSAVGDAPVPVAGVPATVPGCVHTDLLAAGLIDDPYLDANEVGLAWIGRTGWRYETTFAWSGAGAERTELVCAGLDTVAEVAVNGTVVGSTRNQHRSYRFDVGSVLRPGDNTVAITFTSAYAYAEGVRDAVGDLPNAYPQPFNFIRKMACNFGWDWGPTLVTAGIWRPIGLHGWSTARLARVRPHVTVDPDGTGRVAVHVDVARAGADVPLLVTARLGDVSVTGKVADGDTAVVELVVPQPARWYPRGYGQPALHELTVGLATADGTALDDWRRRVGFRTVELDTRPDGIGERFVIAVNGEPISVKGANWIPDDCFPTRVDRDRYAARIAQATEANINLLRVWGGGRYESEDFYELCDAAGVLVWQDFLFACAAYPEEDVLATEVEAEAREQVARLMPYPSLVLWNGNNENIEGWYSWEGWRAALAERTWGAGYYLDLLPRIVAEVDPTRPYWPGSPYSGNLDRDPLDDRYGTKHIWDVWNRRDYTGYRDYVPRFAAEFGFQAPPAFATLRRAISDEPLAPDSPGMLHHQKADGGNGKLDRGLAHHFGRPADFDEWHYLTQVNQARALTLGLEHFRSHWPVCSGTVIWQLNDCWPVTSWAAVDGDGRRKPLWYALRRAYADRLLTVQPRDGGLVVAVVNDAASPWPADVTLVRRSLSGEPLATHVASVRVAPRSVRLVPVPERLAHADDPARELLVVTCGQWRRALWFFAVDRDIDYPAPDLVTQVSPAEGGVRVTVTARSLVRDLVLQADRVHPAATVDDALITLLPGESARLRVSGVSVADAAALTTPPVLRCVNDAGRG
ncbi:glycoside hydrolase family 2 protein [Luedemannella helvata]|uniref:beta-mannosidase n=1 Tax=Luedemannella helvata TaxID=349315 RepID=A0ABN2JXV1_9ACTN